MFVVVEEHYSRVYDSAEDAFERLGRAIGYRIDRSKNAVFDSTLDRTSDGRLHLNVQIAAGEDENVGIYNFDVVEL